MKNTESPIFRRNLGQLRHIQNQCFPPRHDLSRVDAVGQAHLEELFPAIHAVFGAIAARPLPVISQYFIFYLSSESAHRDCCC